MLYMVKVMKCLFVIYLLCNIGGNIVSSRINKVIISIIALAFCISILPNAMTISYAEEKFEIDLKVGYDGYVVPNEVTPVRIEIKNNFKDIEGKVQLLVEEKLNQKEIYTAFSKKINIAMGTTKVVNMESTFYRNGNLLVRVLDRNSNIVFERRVKHLNLKKPDNYYMGVLSENIDILRYLSKTYSSAYNKRVNTYFEMVKLDENIFENYKTLRIFNSIVINNYDSEKLNSSQKEALKDWVESGGLLLIGTGSNHQKTLKGLESIDFLDIKGTKTMDTSIFPEKEPLIVIDADLKSGEKIFVEDKEDLPIYHKKIGKGNVVITSFDLGLSPFGKWNENDEFMNKIINKYLNKKAYSYIDSKANMQSHWFNNIVSYLPLDFLPSMYTIIIILMLFILIVGPVNYLALKKLDKRELIWITIPMIVILFSASIYTLGFKTRLREPIANNVSIINIDHETNTANIITKSGLMGFKNGDWNVTFDNTKEVFLEDRRQHDVIQRFGNKEIVTEYIFNKEKEIVFKKAGILDVETVMIKHEIKLDDRIDRDFRLKDGKIVGEINNTSGIDLDDVVIFYGYNYVQVGDLKSGEKANEITLDPSKISSNTSRNWYDLLDSLYGRNRGYSSFNPQQQNKDRDSILNDDIKRDIIEGLFRSDKGVVNSNKFFLVAWNRDDILGSIKLNNKEAKNLDRNLILIPLDISYQKGDEVKIPYGILYPEVVESHNMNLENYGEILYGDGYAVLEFNAEENIEIISMEIDYDINNRSDKFDIFIYNFIEKDWELLAKKNIIIDQSNKEKYYKEKTGALMKVDATSHTDIYLPKFAVEGVIK